MSKLRILFAIPCLALSMALVGCGSPEGTFEPVEEVETDISVDSADDGSNADSSIQGGDAPVGAEESDVGFGDG